jgi:hypothetical protein
MRNVLIFLIVLVVPGVPFLASYLHLSHYYEFYGITIQHWVTIDEMISLCIDNFVTYSYQLVLVLIISIPVIFLESHLVRAIEIAKGPAQKSRFKRVRIFSLLISIPLMLYLAFFDRSEMLVEVLSGVVLSIVTIGIMWAVFKSPDFLMEVFNFRFTIERRIAFFIPTISFAVLIVHSSLSSFAKQSIVEADTRNVTAIVGNQKIDSLKYLGKTNEEFFFVRQLNGDRKFKAYIIPRHKVEKIEFVGLSKDLVIY